VQVLAFALFVAVQVAAQNVPNVPAFSRATFPPAPPPSYSIPQVALSIPQGVSILFPVATTQVPYATPKDPAELFPYAVPLEGTTNPPEQAQCKFSDGKVITVDYSTRHVEVDDFFFRNSGIPQARWSTVFNDIRFVTDSGLIAPGGMSVPVGKYAIFVPQNTYPRMFRYLVMRARDGEESHVALSFTYLASGAQRPEISFEHTCGSCVMRVNFKNWKQEGSVEFTEENADVPVVN
jgi:hypothetical protein